MPLDARLRRTATVGPALRQVVSRVCSRLRHSRLRPGSLARSEAGFGVRHPAALQRRSRTRARVRRYPGSIAELIHTCYRVLDLERSVGFYERLGLEELRRMPIGDEATNCFMGLPGDGPRLELTYNHDVSEPYEIGTGYGHIAIAIEDLDGTLERLAEAGIEPEKPPYRVRKGGSRICFVRDPDGYRVELIDRSAAR